MDISSFGMNGVPAVGTEKISWVTVALILSILGAFLVYFLFVKPDKKYDNKYLNWLKSFLNFDNLLLEVMFKILYIFTALYITLVSFDLISISFYYFLYYLIGGNIVARIVYEIGMTFIGIWKNTSEIKKKMK